MHVLHQCGLSVGDTDISFWFVPHRDGLETASEKQPWRCWVLFPGQQTIWAGLADHQPKVSQSNNLTINFHTNCTFRIAPHKTCYWNKMTVSVHLPSGKHVTSWDGSATSCLLLSTAGRPEALKIRLSNGASRFSLHWRGCQKLIKVSSANKHPFYTYPALVK